MGTEYERVAIEYLERRGVHILENNFRCRIGEIDLIAKDGKYLVFVEVKFRNSNEYGYPSEAINYHKIKKICKVSDYYRMINHIGDDIYIRYDVISIKGNEIEWIRNAFEYQ